MNHDLSHAFTEYACQKLDENMAQIRRCAGLLSIEALWSRANGHCNAVGNLILHLTGNVRQWIVASIGGQPFERRRQAEFDQRHPTPAAELMPALDDVIRSAKEIIRAQTTETLPIRHQIQAYDVDRMTAIFHVVEHFSGHTGQIVHMTKALLDVSLSVYDETGRRTDGQTAP
ncbi:MAG: DUF1572 family protein [Phycisphaerales bacterium]|nr:DUF1572 family protein [Phycisphaerales bacterium]